MEGWTDSWTTDRLWYVINIPFFLKKKRSKINKKQNNQMELVSIHVGVIVVRIQFVVMILLWSYFP